MKNIHSTITLLFFLSLSYSASVMGVKHGREPSSESEDTPNAKRPCVQPRSHYEDSDAHPMHLSSDNFRVLQNILALGDVKELAAFLYFCSTTYSTVPDDFDAIDITQLDHYGNTILHHLATYPHSGAAMTYALKNGAIIDAQNQSGITPLHAAVTQRNITACTFLLRNRAHPNIPETTELATPLHNAIEMSETDIARLLLSYHADVDAKNESLSTPLHWALLHDNDRMAETLVIDYHANIQARDGKQWTPLHIAARFGKIKMLALLLYHRAYIDAVSDDGTALHIAAETGHFKIVRYLIKHGANINVSIPGQNTVLYNSVNCDGKENPKMIAYLLGKGADIKALNRRNSTAVDRAIERNRIKSAQILLAHGASINQTSTTLASTQPELKKLVTACRTLDILIEHKQQNNILSLPDLQKKLALDKADILMTAIALYRIFNSTLFDCLWNESNNGTRNTLQKHAKQFGFSEKLHQYAHKNALRTIAGSNTKQLVLFNFAS